MTAAEKRLNIMAPSSNRKCNGEQGELLILFYVNYHRGENVVKKNTLKHLGTAAK